MQAASTRRAAAPHVGRPIGVRAASTRLRAPNGRGPTVARVTDVSSEAEFAKEVLECDRPVLVDFWATWCGPCKLMAPLMVWAEQEYGSALKVVKVDCTSQKDLMTAYKVYGLPNLIAFEGGKPVEGSQREGAVTKALLKAYIEKHFAASVAA